MSPPSTLLLLLHILLVPSTLSSKVCLHHHGCYQDHHLLLNHSTAFHSYETKRNAEMCARLCVQKRPTARVVLVKLEGVDKLLSCGCGDEEVLGNRTGLTLRHGACYLCPDSERDKCGGDATSSVYFLDRSGKEQCTRNLLHVPPPVILPPTTTEEQPEGTEEPVQATEEPELPPVQVYGGTSDVFPQNGTQNFAVDADAPSLPHLRHLGCYDESDVNITLVVTKVVVDGGYGGHGDVGIAGGVKYCADNCSAAFPMAADVFLLKAVARDVLYCGCAKREALALGGGTSRQCSLRCGEGRAASPPPCGGWLAVSAYERSVGAVLRASVSLSVCLFLLTLFIDC